MQQLSGPLEISDLIVAHDPETQQRRPVERAAVVAALQSGGQRRAARIVARMPAPDGILDPGHVDAILVRSHAELQRLSEEFLQPRRVLALLRPTIEAHRTAYPGRRIRVVDLGCGLGYLVRWLAARGDLGVDVELVGVDFNSALVSAAQNAAAAEDLDCRFQAGDAFRLDEPADIMMSVGVLHHFAPADLVTIFRRHEKAGVAAFLHYDIAPTWLAPFGAWLFHMARMREPLARHDGVVSARRSHTDRALTDAAAGVGTGYAVGIFGRPPRLLPVTRIIRPLVGFREQLVDEVRSRLGPLDRFLELA